jgi:hypothetical protein
VRPRDYTPRQLGTLLGCCLISVVIFLGKATGWWDL